MISVRNNAHVTDSLVEHVDNGASFCIEAENGLSLMLSLLVVAGGVMKLNLQIGII